MTSDQDYQWRHGWIPLTMHAALQKTRGDHDAAAALLEEARRRRRGRRRPVEFVTPHPAHQQQHAMRSLSDDDLAAAMGEADEAQLGRIVAELDRRDRAARKARRDAASRPARRAAARDAQEQAKAAAFDAACDAGEDPEAAYAAAYGITEEKVRRDAAAASLRSSGYRGKSFAELARNAHRDYAAESYAAAEDECRGQLLNKAGAAAGVHPGSLFAGPEARARKYASEELLAYWQRTGRLTVEDFTAGLLGGHMRSTGTAAWS